MRPPVKRAFVVLASILALLATNTACSGESDSFEGRLQALDGAYTRGQQARESISKLGIQIDTETACNDAWVKTGVRDEETDTRYTENEDGKRVEDKAFQEMRRLSFINGCMNRPNNLSSTQPSAPASAPTPSASAG